MSECVRSNPGCVKNTADSTVKFCTVCGESTLVALDTTLSARQVEQSSVQQSLPATTQEEYLPPAATANQKSPILTVNFQLKGDSFKDFIFFDKMITLKIIPFLYWFFLFLAVLAGGYIMFFLDNYDGFTFKNFLLGLVAIIVLGVIFRMLFELLIVLFKINENIKKFADRS